MSGWPFTPFKRLVGDFNLVVELRRQCGVSSPIMFSPSQGHFPRVLMPLLLALLGNWCQVSAQSPGKIVFSRGLTSSLMAINGDGTGQTYLTSGGSLRDSNPVYSPDGTKIAFDRDISNAPNVFVMNSDGTNPVKVISAGPSTTVSFSSDPTWSPDGTKLAFVSDLNGTEKREIFVVNVDGSGLVQLTTNILLTNGGVSFYSSDLSPSWSPDGSRIVFSSDRNGQTNREIYVMNVDGSNQTRLTNNSTDDLWPTWSPDSQKIAFYNASVKGINIMDRTGANLVNITHDFSLNPAWSPDGTKLAFDSYDPVTSKQQIFIINIDGSNVTHVTNNDFDCASPAWAPLSSPPISTSKISGHVVDSGGAPIMGAALTLTGTLTRTTQSDSTGGYSFAGLPAGNYRIDISKSGFGFTPSFATFTNLTADQISDFAGFIAFSISGQVSGLNGTIVVNLSGSQNRSVQTDSPSGNYSFDFLPAGGSYTLSFNSQIWNISPNGATFNNLSSNQTANFTAVRFTYTISGTITRLGNPLSGISVALDNLSGFTPPTTTTDANGHYSFANVTAGINYLIRPTAGNYVFSPQTQGFNQLDGNKTADFVALSANHLLFNTRFVFGGASNNCNLVLNVLRGGNAQGVGPITVHYATSDDSAISGSDYVAVNGTLNFPEGTFSQTVTVPLLAGQVTGLPRIFFVTLSNPTGEVDLGDPARVTVVLTDPAPPSSLALATQPNTNQAVALNASNQLAEPFSLSTPINFSEDIKTRGSFFVSGAQFNACQGTNVLFFSGMDAQQHSFSGTVENVLKLPGNNPYLQFNVQLPQGFITGDWTISFTLGNLTTNTAHFSTHQ